MGFCYPSPEHLFRLAEGNIQRPVKEEPAWPVFNLRCGRGE